MSFLPSDDGQVNGQSMRNPGRNFLWSWLFICFCYVLFCLGVILPYCDTGSDCGYYIIIGLLTIPITLNIIAWVIFISSKKNQKFEQNWRINRAIGILEIVLCPIIIYFLYIKDALLYNDHHSLNSKIGLFLVAIFILWDGIKKIRVKNNPRS